MICGEDLAGRLVVGLAGTRLTRREAGWLERWRPAGVILFSRNASGPGQTAALCRRLHDLVPDLEIMTDHEGGPVAPLAAAVGRPPVAWGLGLLDDPDLTRRVHESTGERLAGLGLDRVLAPVADVLTERRNPVIGVRSFGSRVDLVSRHVAAAVAGLLAGGCRVCLKHWPGHGGSATDSHLATSTLAAEPDAMPFQAGLEAGADAIMLGHLRLAGAPVATLDPDRAAAARILGQGRAPLLFADDVTMGGLRQDMAALGVEVPAGAGLVEPQELSTGWLAALAGGGCDRLLVRGIPWGAFPCAGVATEAAVADIPEQLSPSPAAWQEAWRGLADRLPADLELAARTPGWLDRTAGDRWGPADDPDAGYLLPRGHGFCRLDSGLPPGTDLLLVTSHRPLDAGLEGAGAWLEQLAPRGVALAVGHPSLATDLAALLPVDWEVHETPEWPVDGR